MLEQGKSFSNSSAFVLVAAGSQDAQATALVRAMREASLRVIFAETVTLAARASEVAACIIILRQDTWKAQTIATVMRAKPTCLIPVLAEPMDLPGGPWTHEAIQIGDDLAQSAQEVIQVVRDYLATRSASVSRTNSEALTINTILKSQKRRRLRVRPFFTTLLVLLIAALGLTLAYRYYTNPSVKSQSISPHGDLSTPVSTLTYSAKTPGPNCDLGGGQWEQANRYKKDKKTEVLDKYTTLQCQSDGSLVTRSGDYHFYSTVFFDGVSNTQPLAQHYFAQVSVTVVSGDAQADVAMEVHASNSYGRYRFGVNTLGHWEANVTNTVDGTPLQRLAIGFLPKASKTYTLAVDVSGPMMTFWIDEAKVTTVTDTTYTANASVSFAISDYTATQPISALFSNFQYKKLTPSMLTTSQVVATATTQAQSGLQGAYNAHTPGYGCDQGAGQWQPLADQSGNNAVLQCSSGGMQLTEPANATNIGEEDFYWLNGHFPQNYTISARIDVSRANDECAGLETRMNGDGESYGAYAFIICPDGSWEIALITTTFQSLAHGQVNARNVYQIAAVSNGSDQSLSINGELVKTSSDSHLKNTDHLALAVGFYNGKQSASATFSDFVLTPLP